MGVTTERLAAYETLSTPDLLTRIDIPIQVPLRDALSMAGYVFVTTGTSGGTDAETSEVAASFAIDALEPSFLMDIPSGIAVLPLNVNLAFETWADPLGHCMIAIMSDDQRRYSSGGAAAVVARSIHLRGYPNSVVEALYSGDTAITAVAEQAERLHAQYLMPDDYLATEGLPLGIFDWIPKLGCNPVLVGPASFLVYVHSYGTTGAEFRISVTWAELPESMV